MAPEQIIHSRREEILATEQEFGPMFKAVKTLPQVWKFTK
jgi:hypothetical protein